MTNKLIAVVVGVVIVAGVGYYVMQNRSSSSTGDQNSGTSLADSEDSDRNDTPGTDTGGRFSGSMTALAARGGNYKCTYTQSVNGSESSGTIYTSGNKMRGDFTSVSSGTSVESHMLMMDGYMYTWSPEMSTGMKMKVAGVGGGDTTGAQGSYADANQMYDYDCNSWREDGSVFTPPVDINFMEFGQ